MEALVEFELWTQIRTLSEAASGKGRTPRAVIAEMLRAGRFQSPKQAWRTLEKWGAFYEYGVTLDLGWKMDDATFPRSDELSRLIQGWLSQIEPIAALPDTADETLQKPERLP